jgi:hypothetical protein
MKLCKDCANYLEADDEQLDKCNYYNMVSLIRGTPEYKYCDLMRDIYGACGEEANFFVVRFDNANTV